MTEPVDTSLHEQFIRDQVAATRKDLTDLLRLIRLQETPYASSTVRRAVDRLLSIQFTVGVLAVLYDREKGTDA